MDATPKVRRIFDAAALLLAFCATSGSFPAAAVDDRFDATKYDKGGFAPAKDPTYLKECGACHFAYLPGTLPARSWHAIMAKSDDHFGESLSLPPHLAMQIEQYLAANAADHSDYRGSALILDRLEDNVTPMKIIRLPYIRQRHQVIRKLLNDHPQNSIKGLSNCTDCHPRAAEGSFVYREVVVPGIIER